LTKATKARGLTDDERALARGIFGRAIDYDAVRIVSGKWAFFQPKKTVMAPTGHIHFHPDGPHYCDDFCKTDIDRQGLFIHEMVHVWQAQTRGRWYLPLHRHAFCRYSYALKPGWSLDQYGIEAYRAILPFLPEE
jgi:hypothetical protein